MKYIKGLDTLRAFAVILVIHQHWGPFVSKSIPFSALILQKIIPTGEFAVNLFFVLSGFLISNILLKSKEELGNGSKFKILKNFAIRRALRIFPIYFLCLFFLFFENDVDVRRYFFYFATYTSNFLVFHLSAWNSFSHTWTLAVEEQFYLIWPFVIVFTPKKFLLPAMFLFILIGTIGSIITENVYGHFAPILTFNCFNAFAIGALYSYVLIEKNQIGTKIRKTLIILLPFALAFYILFQAGFNIVPIRLSQAIISVNLIIYITEKRYGKIAGFFINNKLLNSLGKISYGVYLYHYNIRTYYTMALKFLEKDFHSSEKTNNVLNQPYVVEVMEFIVLILFSYLSYYCIEVQILKLKKYYQYNYMKEPRMIMA